MLRRQLCQCGAMRGAGSFASAASAAPTQAPSNLRRLLATAASSSTSSASKAPVAAPVVASKASASGKSSSAPASSPSSSSSSTATAASAGESALAPSPFLAWKHPVTGRWRPPQYSARRQAQVAGLALQLGTLDELPRSRKVNALRARAAGNARLLQAHEATSAGTPQGAAREAYGLGGSGSDPSPSGSSSGGAPAVDEAALSASFRGWKLSAGDDAAIASAIVRAMKDRGPYSGRKKMFKGTKAARTLKARQAKVQERLDKMQDTVREWRQAKLAAKAKVKPSLPF